MRGIYRHITILSFTCTCLFSHAAMPPQQLVIEIKKPAVMSQPDIEIAKIIPTNLQPGQKEEQIGLRVIDHSVNSFTQGDFFKNTEIGKAAKGFEESLKTDVNLGGDPKKGEVSHNVNVQVLAFEQKAFIHYRGLTDFQVTYKYDRNNIDVKLEENLGGNTNLVITHNLQDQFSRANLSWTW